MSRSRSASLVALFSSLAAGVLLAACGSDRDVTTPEATETNFFVAACYSDEDCPNGFCKLHEQQPPPDSGTPRGLCQDLP